MTTPLDPYASATSNLPSATQNMIPGNIIGSNNQTINTAELNLSSSGGGAILGYSGTPTAGNLTFSLSSASGPDTFGNSVPTGLMVGSGSITGVSLTGVQMDSTSTLQNTTINGPSVIQPSIAGGTATSLVHTMTNGSGGVLGYTSGTVAATFSTNGNYLWTCPTGVTAIRVQTWGAGAGGGGGNATEGGESGGGGEYAEEPSLAVVPAQVYSIIVGQGGNGGSTGNAGASGGQTVFQNQTGTSVTANGGNAGSGGVGGNGGSGSPNTINFDGGDGANSSGNTGGAAGASSASYAGEGVNGVQSTGSGTTSPAGPPAGAGSGGTGAAAAGNGFGTGSPGGGGGGAGANAVVSSSKTYPCADPGGTYSYRGPDAHNGPNALINHDGPLYQGFPNPDYGTQYSYWILPWAQIQSDLAGVTITSVSMKIKCLFSYYSGGVYAHVWYTNLDSFGSAGNKDSGSPVLVKNFAMTENETTTQSFGLNGSIGTALQSGAAKSIQFNSYPPSGGLFPAGDYYGSWDSGANNGVIPALVVYYNSGGGSFAGAGSDGQVILSYQSGTVPTFQLSVSATAGADVFGNPYNQGFTGPLLTLTNQTTTISTNTAATSIGSNTAGTPVATNSQGFTGTMAQIQTDNTLNVVTGTSPVALSKGYVIPAGDPQVGTIYRLTTWGDWATPASGSLPQDRWYATLGGVVHTGVIIGGANQSVSTTYGWYLTSLYQFGTVGSGGNANTWMQLTVSEYLANSTANASQIMNTGATGTPQGSFVGQNAANAVSTLTAFTLQTQGDLSASPSGAQIRCFGSMLERLGP